MPDYEFGAVAQPIVSQTWRNEENTVWEWDPLVSEMDHNMPEFWDTIHQKFGSSGEPGYSEQTKNVDIINQLADLESNRVGSILYNPEDLAVYKSSYFSTDQDLNAGMEMQYNYAIKNVADDKIYDYEKQISDIDDKIKDTYNQDQKNQLAIQKNSLNQELSYVKKLSEKLKPLTVEDTYLQSFYPEEYSRKKAKQKQEVFKNERLAEGDQGSWAETLGRNWDNYTSNVAMQLS